MASMPRMGEFAGRIRRLLHCGPPPEPEPSEVLEAGDFRIDLGSRRALVRGQELHLDAAEFDLLVFLVGHPRRIVTPRTLLQTRWGNQGVRQTDFLHVFNSLRRKVEFCAGGGRYLRTEPWIFYRFEPDPTAGPSSS